MVRDQTQFIQQIMTRKKSHFEDREPLLEKILSAWRFRKIIRHIPKNARVLDLGCGFNGKLLQKIREKISSGVGVDISVNLTIKDPRIRLFAQNLNNPSPFSGDTFDIVTSLANLEHLQNPENNLREIRRVLKPSGVLLLTTPSIYGKPVLETLAFFGIISREEIRDHKNYFNKKILTELCSRAGFTSISHRYFQIGMNNFVIAKNRLEGWRGSNLVRGEV